VKVMIFSFDASLPRLQYLNTKKDGVLQKKHRLFYFS
jgi:hypothetical protein